MTQYAVYLNKIFLYSFYERDYDSAVKHVMKREDIRSVSDFDAFGITIEEV